jgi:uncharacterized protein RhaS with RHS repeats
LHDYGYRFYSPVLGRWLNRDPIGEADDMNLYAFVANSPTNYADTNGLARIELRWRTVTLGPVPSGGNHAFLLIWDTNDKGEKVGCPKYFGGYKGDGFGNGTALNALNGNYTGPKHNGLIKGAPDYFYWPGHPMFAGSRTVIDDNRPASYYVGPHSRIVRSIGARLTHRYGVAATGESCSRRAAQ